MKKLQIENVLNPKRLLTHFTIIAFSAIMVLLNIFRSTEPQSVGKFISSFLLVFIQIELFIYLGYLIFRNVKPGTTQREITRIVLSRFSFFIGLCFVSAFIIFIGFLFLTQILHGGDISNVTAAFFKYEFKGWFKATISGLLLGGGLFLFMLWQEALENQQKLREENLIFQNETLKNQINPHFLFNSLNTISSLIHSQPESAENFINNLSSVYRYILENSQKDKVKLKSELEFITDYFNLHKIRDEEKIILTIDTKNEDEYEILPVSLQIMIENAIKHNLATRENPLRISIFIEDKFIVVRNNLQKKATQMNSMKTGLKNLAERVKLITGGVLIIEETNADFVVKIPLI